MRVSNASITAIAVIVSSGLANVEITVVIAVLTVIRIVVVTAKVAAATIIIISDSTINDVKGLTAVEIRGVRESLR